MVAACSWPTRTRSSSLRGVGTVVGAVIVAVMAILVIGYMVYVLHALTQAQEEALTLLQRRAEAAAAPQAVTGYWRLNYPAPGDLYIHVTSHYSQALEVAGLVVVWSDGTATVLDRHTGSLSAVNVYVEVETATGTQAYDRFPIPLPPGANLSITLQGYANGRTPLTVSLALSQPAATVAESVQLKAYQPPPSAATANASTITSLLGTTQANIYNYAKTWLGTMTAEYPVYSPATVTGYTVDTGSYVSSTAASLQAKDGDTLQVDAAQTIVVTGFTISSDNLVYATDFNDQTEFTNNWETDPTTSWVWAPGIGVNATAAINQTNLTIASSSVPGYEYNRILGRWIYEERAEYIAYPSTVAASTLTSYYILAATNVSQYSYYNDIVLFNSSGYILAAGIEANQLWTGDPAAPSLVVKYYDPGAEAWSVVNSSAVNTAYFTYDSWYAMLLHVTVNSTGTYLWLTAYDTSNQPLGTLVASQQGFTPSQLGVGETVYNYVYLGTTYADGLAYMDNFIVSRANPRFINITVTLDGSPVSGWTLQLYNGSGYLVAEAQTNASGVAVLDVTWQPVVRGAYIKVYDSSGTLVAVVDASAYISGGTLYGGNAYTLSLGTRYTAEVTAESYVDLANTTLVRLAADFSTSVAYSYTLYAYNWNTSSYDAVASGSGLGETVVNITELLSSGYVASNGSVKLRLLVYAVQTGTPFTLSIDVLNAYQGTLVTQSFRGLLVAEGGGDGIEVLEVSSTGGLTYLYTMPAYTVFNGSATITYDPVDGKLVLVNGSGVYWATVSPDPQWSLVTSACSALAGVEAEVVNYTATEAYLVVLQGGGTGSYCVVDLAAGTLVASSSLTGYVVDPAKVYPASSPTNGETAYFLVYKQSTGQAVVLQFNYTSAGISYGEYAASPGAYVVGMAGDGPLWLLLERGGLYYVSSSGATRVSGLLDFVPWGPGDRLEVYNATTLLFVRGDGTNEVWLLRTG